MDNIETIRSLLQKSITISKEKLTMFFKTTPGHYAEHDQFIGVTVPMIRKIAKDFQSLSLPNIHILLVSPINEERLLALIILVHQYQKGTNQTQEELYQFYLQNLHQINNWNLVDSSAHLIIGTHLLKTDKNLLFTLAQSDNLWERRIAIVATWHFIRHNDLAWTFKISKILLNDKQDLIDKAVGWMLREAGKKDQSQLEAFLDQHAHKMPRTMLRYALEKFSEDQRKLYLKKS